MSNLVQIEGGRRRDVASCGHCVYEISAWDHPRLRYSSTCSAHGYRWTADVNGDGQCTKFRALPPKPPARPRARMVIERRHVVDAIIVVVGVLWLWWMLGG